MKKIAMRAIWIVACLSSFPLFANEAGGPEPTDQITSDPMSDMTVDEYVFASQLDDDNKQTFQQMSSKDRQKCMQMTQQYNSTGVVLSPDQAVEKVASMMGE